MDTDQLFCSSQIVIPPILPSILKKYAKAAIRTQPYDLLVWSAAYFRAMADGTTPPVKPKLEFPYPEHKMLTLGYVKLLVYQFGRGGDVTRDELTQKWNDICLPADVLYNILRLGSFAHSVDWNKFIAICLGYLETSLKATMLRVCEVMTEEPDGGSAMIPFKLFLSLYRYLGELECGKAKVKMISTAVPAEEKQPCFTFEKETEEDSVPGKDIDSIVREIGKAESIVSIDTRLEGVGIDFDWPNLESKSESDMTELRVPSEPSDIGASKYGLEAMAEDSVYEETRYESQRTTARTDEMRLLGEEKFSFPPEKGEIKVLHEEKRRFQHSDNDSEISADTERDIEKGLNVLEASTSISELVPSTQKDTMNEIMDWPRQDVQEQEDVEEEPSETESMKILFGGKEEEESPSEKDSQVSETKKALIELDANMERLEKSASLEDLRTTMDRNTRRNAMDNALLSEDKRRNDAKAAAAEAAEKSRIEEEAKEKFHMHVPGIGPKLPDNLMETFEEYMRCCANRQADMVMPRNIRHFLCPPMDLDSPVQVDELVTLLDETTQIPEYKVVSSHQSDIIELIKQESSFNFESSGFSSQTTESTHSAMANAELSITSGQAQVMGRAISLNYLLN